MLNLDANIDLDVKKFFRWWGSELSHLLPEEIKKILDQQQSKLILRPHVSTFSLTYEVGEACENLGEFSRDAAGVEAIKKILAKDARYEKTQFIVRLAPSDAIGKELTFPIAAAENLQQVIAYEIDRLTPFNKDQVYFSVKLVEKNKQTGIVRLILVLTPKDKLDALLDELTALTLHPSLIDYEPVSNQPKSDVSHYNLLPAHRRENKIPWHSYVHGGLTALFFLLLTVAMVLPVWLESRAVAALRDDIAVIEKEARAVENIQAEIDAVIVRAQQLIAKKQQSPAIVDILNTLSELIKDDTWLNYLRFNEGRLQFQGQSPAASALISKLEESELFANARFVSPVTRDRLSGLERFQLSVDIKPRSDDDATR